jgi:hypothetical protein
MNASQPTLYSLSRQRHTQESKCIHNAQEIFTGWLLLFCSRHSQFFISSSYPGFLRPLPSGQLKGTAPLGPALGSSLRHLESALQLPPSSHRDSALFKKSGKNHCYWQWHESDTALARHSASSPAELLQPAQTNYSTAVLTTAASSTVSNSKVQYSSSSLSINLSLFTSLSLCSLSLSLDLTSSVLDSFSP